MALAELNKIDERLMEIYKDQVTTNATSTECKTQDNSKILFDQMQMIAFNNKMFLNLR